MKVALLVLAVGLSVGCGQIEQTTKQTPSFANLQFIAQELQRRVTSTGSVSVEEAKTVIDTYNQGRDEWGGLYLFKSRATPRFAFIVVSLGRDRALDVGNLDEYFEAPDSNIVGKFDRDIVFRDGRCVTIASPK